MRPEQQRSRPYLPLLLILLFSFPLLVVRLNRDLLVDWDECVYSVQAMEMKENGNYWTNHWNGIADLQKPPLYTWLLQIPYLFGVTEFNTRVISVFLGLGLVAAVYVFCIIFFSTVEAVLAGLLLFASELFVATSIRANTDIGFTVLAFLGFFFWMNSREKKRFVYFAGISFGLAVMMKGLGVLPLLFAMFLGLFLRAEKERFIDYARLIVTFLITILPWHLAEYFQYREQFADEYFYSSILKRSRYALESHEGPWNKFLAQFKQMLFPWIYIAFIFPFKLGSDLLSQKLRDVLRKEELMITLMLVIGILLLSISTMKTKLPWYSLPIYPFLVIYLSRTIAIIINALRAGTRLAYFTIVVFLTLDAGYCIAQQTRLFQENREITTRHEVYLQASRVPGTDLHYLLGRSPRTRLMNYGEHELLPNTLRFGGNPCAVHYSGKKVIYHYNISEFQESVKHPGRLFLIRNEDAHIIGREQIDVIFRNGDYTLFQTGKS